MSHVRTRPASRSRTAAGVAPVDESHAARAVSGTGRAPRVLSSPWATTQTVLASGESRYILHATRREDEHLVTVEIAMKLVVHPPVVDNCAGTRDALREIVDAEAFFGKMTPELLTAAKRLEWVQSPTASLEHYLFPELVAHAARLSNMRGIFSDVIADHVFGYILCFARNLHLYLRRQTERTWAPIGGEGTRSSYSVGPGETTPMDRSHIHVGDQTLGVVGCGAIGSEVARRGVSFGMRVLAVDPAQTEAPDGVEALWPIEGLDELLARSDFVVIAAPHTPSTEGLFDRARIAGMKRSACLINIGRGVIVRLDDLCDALEAGDIAGAALDVYEVEPLPRQHRLWKLENVILTPHVAACSVRVPERHLETLLENVRRFAHGEEPLNIVSKTEWF